MRSLIISIVLLLAAVAVCAAPQAQSFFPKDGVTQFLVQNLDLATFRSSLGPRLSPEKHTFAGLGVVATHVTEDDVVFEDDEWSYKIRILRRADINKDGIEDLEVCFTDRAKQGTYSTQQALLVTRYSSSSYVVALRFEVNGCEAY